jgi:sugar phosphate isomerase/epimerase
MTPCISQATTLNNPFESDPAVFSRAGWTAVEIWLTKLESFLDSHTITEARSLLESNGIKPVAAAVQGGLLLSQGTERTIHWDHFRRRLTMLQELQVPTLVIAPDFARQPVAEDFEHAAESLNVAAALAATFGVRLALEFQKSSALCACLETALALIEHSGAANVGVCFDVFHYYTGPSKYEDLAYLSPENLALVQFCDMTGTARELAGDSDRILPGEGDFQLGPIVDHFERIGYQGPISLEVLNPHLWQVPADRVADLGYQALCRVLSQRKAATPESRGGS